MENQPQHTAGSRHLRLISTLLKRLILTTLVVVLLLLLTPYLLNTFILPRFTPLSDPAHFSLSITSLTPWSLSGHLSIGPPDEPGIHLPRITIHYSPIDLLKGVIDTVSVEGGSVQLAVKGRQFSIRNVALPSDENNDKSTSLQLPALPFQINHIELKNIHTTLERPHQPNIVIDTQLFIHPSFSGNLKKNFSLVDLDVDFTTSGSLKADLQAHLMVTDASYDISFNAQLPELDTIPSLLPLVDHFQLRGNGQLHGTCSLSHDFRSAEAVEGQITLPELELDSPSLKLGGSHNSPLTLQFSGTNELIRYELHNFSLAQPIPLQTNIEGSFAPMTGTLQGKGVSTTPLLTAPVTFSFQGSNMGEAIKMSLSVEGKKQLFGMQSEIVSLGPYSLHISAQKTGEGIRTSQQLKFSSLAVPQKQLQFQNISATFTHEFNSDSLTDLAPGNFAIGTITYKNEDLAGIQGTLQPLRNGLAFSGTLDTHLASPLQFTFAGSSTADKPLEFQLQLPASSIDSFSLPAFAALPPELYFSGKLQLEAGLLVTNNQPQGYADITLTDGELTVEEQDIAIQGMNTTLHLDDLLRLTSSPSQHLSISNIHLGSVKLQNGSVYYRVESSDTLFIEKSSFTWCSGKVESGSLRISTKKPELSTTLYCDRLQFSELLNQVGISDTEGDGSLNGRLPLHFSGQEIVFDDGFLFSTPGNSGIVRFKNSEMLRQGMANMGNTAYLEYAIQAMENFSYNWTKLTFNTEGEDLLVKMQIDGKPAAPLPFGYKSGQLTKDMQGAGIQHPIRLDVNFHLPIMQLLKYGRNLKKFMEKM